jgi:protein-L-isoaspartate(D-aspartate) O-methyltransferase
MRTEFSREQMVSQQVRAWSVLDDRVLDLLLRIPRERFVPSEWRAVALADAAIPLGAGQHMLTPQVVGRILQALDLSPDDHVLEIGTGSGYLTACLAGLAHSVRSLEIFGDLAEAAARNLRDAGVRNATVAMMDGSALEERDAYDAVIVTASLPLYDERFERALRIGGRLFVVVGESAAMEARLVRRVEPNAWSTTSLFETRIEPLVNARRREAFRF